jgi:hypothetical protein
LRLSKPVFGSFLTEAIQPTTAKEENQANFNLFGLEEKGSISPTH